MVVDREMRVNIEREGGAVDRSEGNWDGRNLNYIMKFNNEAKADDKGHRDK